MSKLLLGVVVVVLAIVGWVVWQGDTIEYVAQVDSEVTELEAELAEIDAAVKAGTLTPAQAAEAQTKIVARLDTINGAVAGSQTVKLTESQRIQLLDSLERMKQSLFKYQASLTAVDAAVLELPAADRPQLSRRSGGGNRNSITAAIAETIGTVEDHVEEVIEDYVPAEDIVIDEEIADEVADDSVTDDMTDDVDSTDDVVAEPGDDTVVDDTTDESATDDVSMEIEGTVEIGSDVETTDEDPVVN